MYPETFKHRSKGFTLLEFLVVMVASIILLAMLTRFYKDIYRTYNTQEQVSERNQNASYTLKKLSEVLQQAGAGLPPAGFNAITTIASPPKITIGINPTGGEYFVNLVTPAPPLNKLPISDTALFNGASQVLIYFSSSLTSVTREISSRRKGLAGTLDTLILKTNLPNPLKVADRIYAYRIDAYFVDQFNLVYRMGNLAANDMVLAENIDSLGFTFKKVDGTSTTAWADMRSVMLTVRARTMFPDPKYPATGGYRKITLSTNFLLRNKK